MSHESLIHSVPAGAREGQELRLGRVAQAVPQVPQQQEVARHRPHAQGEYQNFREI